MRDSLVVLSKYLLVMELRFDAVLCSKLADQNSDAGHIECSHRPHLARGPQVPHPCSSRSALLNTGIPRTQVYRSAAYVTREINADRSDHCHGGHAAAEYTRLRVSGKFYWFRPNSTEALLQRCEFDILMVSVSICPLRAKFLPQRRTSYLHSRSPPTRTGCPTSAGTPAAGLCFSPQRRWRAHHQRVRKSDS